MRCLSRVTPAGPPRRRPDASYPAISPPPVTSVRRALARALRPRGGRSPRRGSGGNCGAGSPRLHPQILRKSLFFCPPDPNLVSVTWIVSWGAESSQRGNLPSAEVRPTDQAHNRDQITGEGDNRKGDHSTFLPPVEVVRLDAGLLTPRLGSGHKSACPAPNIFQSHGLRGSAKPTIPAYSGHLHGCAGLGGPALQFSKELLCRCEIPRSHSGLSRPQ